MTTVEFTRGLRANPLNYPAHGVPHATLEINRTCNMRCRCCYNIDRDSVKSFDEVERDLNRAMDLRRLQAVTVLGGEPTLHPDLPRIIALVKGRGLFCQLLTNGLRFLDDDGPALLCEVKRAGIDKILLHVDGGQAHVYGDVEAVRKKLFGLMESRGIAFSLSVTVYNEDRGRMSDVIKRYSRFQHFDGILAVLAREAGKDGTQSVELREEYEGLRAGLGLEPGAYIPSNRGDEDVRWLVYFYLTDAGASRVHALSPLLDRSVRRLFRLLTRRHFFAANLGPNGLRRLAVPMALFEVMTGPRRLFALAALFRAAGSLKNMRLQYIAIQVPPEFENGSDRLIVCRSCPDATVRNGRLVPVCIADMVSPLNPLLEPQLACPEI
jgi:hypothetical protein